MSRHAPQVGAPDPKIETSPVLDDYEEISFNLELEVEVSYLNNVAYPIAQYVQSGSKLPHCEEQCDWVRKAEMRPG